MSSVAAYRYRIVSMKSAATKARLSLVEYVAKLATGRKRCAFCCEWKLVESFTRDKTRRDGLACGCKTCVAANQRARRYRGKEAERGQ